MSTVTSSNPDIKVFATDLDGTLLNSKFEIDDYEKKMLQELQKINVTIALVSGFISFTFCLLLNL